MYVFIYTSRLFLFILLSSFILKSLFSLNDILQMIFVKKVKIQYKAAAISPINVTSASLRNNATKNTAITSTKPRDFDDDKEPTSYVFSAYSPLHPCGFVNGRQSSVMRIRLVVQLTAVYETNDFVSSLLAYRASLVLSSLCPSLFLCVCNVETRTPPRHDSFIIPFTAKST